MIKNQDAGLVGLLVKIGLDSAGLQLTGPLPVSSSTPSNFSLPIKVNGVIYYLKLSDTP